MLLRDISAAAADAARNGRPCKPLGWVQAEIPIESIEHATGQLIRMGADVLVMKPVALREALLREASNIIARYT
jgi:predicted DNA-binding transcriptional regulator YafY